MMERPDYPVESECVLPAKQADPGEGSFSEPGGRPFPESGGGVFTKPAGGSALRAEIKLTLHGEERFFGPGICELLEKIDETGSIQAAAQQMHMSYTKAWKILNRAEKEMQKRLINRVNGGKNGGSSVLTEKGREAVRTYREMEKILKEESERLLAGYSGVFRP